MKDSCEEEKGTKTDGGTSGFFRSVKQNGYDRSRDNESQEPDRQSDDSLGMFGTCDAFVCRFVFFGIIHHWFVRLDH